MTDRPAPGYTPARGEAKFPDLTLHKLWEGQAAPSERRALPEQQRPAPQLAQLRAEIEHVMQELAALKREQKSIRSRLDEAYLAGLSRPALPPQQMEETEEAIADDHDPTQDPWAEADQHFADLDVDFQAEPVDRKWQAETSSLVHDTFSTREGLENTSLEHLECRGERCRLEVSLHTLDASDELESAITDTLPGSLPRMAIH